MSKYFDRLLDLMRKGTISDKRCSQMDKKAFLLTIKSYAFVDIRLVRSYGKLVRLTAHYLIDIFKVMIWGTGQG